MDPPQGLRSWITAYSMKKCPLQRGRIKVAKLRRSKHDICIATANPMPLCEFCIDPLFGIKGRIGRIWREDLKGWFGFWFGSGKASKWIDGSGSEAKPSNSTVLLKYWSRIHERTISLRFLAIILRFLRLEVYPQCLHYKPVSSNFWQGMWVKCVSRGDCE